MNSLLLWFGALLAAVLAALFAVPHFVDWNLYRGQFEAEATRLLGREVRVAGSVAVAILPSPRMSLGRVRIADVPARPGELPGEPILRAERIELGLGISGLLRGDLDIKTVEVVKPELRLTVQADGRGNWQSLGVERAALPIMPNGFSIGSVAISQGQVVLVAGQSGRELLAAGNISGEVEAVSGNGPLRFRGSVEVRGEPYDLRVSTADGEPGTVRVKASLRGDKSGDQISIDGSVIDLAAVPRLVGDVVARFGGAKSAATDGKAVAEAPPKGGGAGVEMRARLEADGRGAKFDNVSLSFERDGQPQLMTGAVTVGWNDAIDIKATMDSRWLDLDRMSAGGAGIRPLDAPATLARVLSAAMPRDGRFNGRLTVDQVTLGGDAVSGLVISATGANGRLVLDKLDGSLPGGGRVALTGSLSGDGETFDGRLSLRAYSAARFLSWAARGSLPAALDFDGPFLLETAVKSDERQFSLDMIEAEVGGQIVRGTVQHRYGQRPSTSLALSAAALDISTVLPGALERQFWSDVVLGRKAASERMALLRWLDPSKQDLSIVFDAGRVTEAGNRVSDVAIAVDAKNGRLGMKKVRFTTAGGAALELTGDVTLGAPADRRGAVNWQLAAADEAGASFLGTLLSFDVATAVPTGIGPWRLAGSVAFSPSDNAAEVTVGGTLGRTRVRAAARTSRDLATWNTTALEGDAESYGPDALVLAGIARAASEDTAGKVSLQFSGIPSNGLLLKAAVARTGSASPDATFDGTLRLADGAVAGLSGRLSLDTRDGSALARLARLPSPGAMRNVRLQGQVGIGLDGNVLTLGLDRLRVGANRLSGVVSRDGTKFEANLVTDRLSLRDLLAPTLAGTTAYAPASGSGVVSHWPEQPFDISGLAKTDATLTLVTSRLEVDEAAALQDVRLSARFAKGAVELTELTGALLGGRFSAKASLTTGVSDVGLNGSIDFTGADLAAIPPGRAGGKAGGALAVTGRGTNPRSLVQSMTGKGEMELRSALLPGLEPIGVQRAAQSFLAADAPPLEGQLQALVKTALAKGSADLGTRKVPLEIVAGALQARHDACRSSRDVARQPDHSRPHVVRSRKRMALRTEGRRPRHPTQGSVAAGDGDVQRTGVGHRPHRTQDPGRGSEP